MAIDDSKEKRQSCKECVSHREHAAEINNLKADFATARGDRIDMWNGIKDKVPYRHFLTAVGFIVTAIAVATTINWTTMQTFTSQHRVGMREVLDSNHRVELQVTKIDAKVENLERRFDDYREQLAKYDNEHEYFKSAILTLMKALEQRDHGSFSDTSPED